MASRDQDTVYRGPCGTSTTPAEAFKLLSEWVEAGRRDGVYLDPNVVFAHSQEWGNGFVALTRWGIPSGTTVVKMPKMHCLTTRTVSSPELRELLRNPQFDNLTGLTVAYIYESLLDTESPWQGYLGCLSLPDVPRLWEVEEKAWLNGTEIEDQTFIFDSGALKVFRQIVVPFFQNHPELFPNIVEMQPSRLDRVFLEAISVVMSRTFPIDVYHGLGLVPLADLFNHAKPGHDNIEFQTYKDVCPECGAPDKDVCSAGARHGDRKEICPVCGHLPDFECDCDTWNDFDYYPSAETALLDPEGRGWTYDWRDISVTRPPETCDLVTRKNVRNKEQLFNSYGMFNNVNALMKYGFIDPDCQIDTVGLRREVFFHPTEYYTPDAERTKFWSQHGFEFLRALAQHEKRPFGTEWEEMAEQGNISANSRDFVIWSLSIGKGGYVRCGLKVWLLIVNLVPEVWKDFIDLSLEAKVEAGLDYLAIFDRPRELDSNEQPTFSMWLNLLRQAVQKRYDRFSQNDKDGYVMRKITKRLTPVDLRTRKGKANWIKDVEIGILSDCEKRVCLASASVNVKLQVNLPSERPNWRHPNGHFTADNRDSLL